MWSRCVCVLWACLCTHIKDTHFCVFVYPSLSLLCLLLFACQFFFVSIIFIVEPICVENRMLSLIIFNDFLFFVTLFSKIVFTSRIKAQV